MKDRIQNILKEAENFASSKIEETKLDTVEKSIYILSGSLSLLILTSIGILTIGVITLVAILSIALLTKSLLMAALLVMLVYVVILIILFIFKKKFLDNPIKNLLLGEYLASYKIK